jgi:hypothetical protein
VFVLRDGEPHAVDELTGILDTPAMIASIKARFVGHAIFVYPDASGTAASRTTPARATLRCCVPGGSPCWSMRRIRG